MTLRLFLFAVVIGLATALGVLGGFAHKIESTVTVGPNRSETLSQPHQPAWHADASTWSDAKRLLNQSVIEGRPTKICTEDASLVGVLNTAVERWDDALNQSYNPLAVVDDGSDGPLTPCKSSGDFDVLLRRADDSDLDCENAPACYLYIPEKSKHRRLFSHDGSSEYSLLLWRRADASVSTMVHELGHVLGLDDYASDDDPPNTYCDHFHNRLIDPLGDQFSVMTYRGDTPECRSPGVITGRDLRDLYEAYHIGPLVGVRMQGSVGVSSSRRVNATFYWGKAGALELSHNAKYLLAQRKGADGWETVGSAEAFKKNGEPREMISVIHCDGVASQYRLVGASAFQMGLNAFVDDDLLVAPMATLIEDSPSSCGTSSESDESSTGAEVAIGDATFVVGVAAWPGKDNDDDWCAGKENCPPVLSASITQSYCFTGAIRPTVVYTPTGGESESDPYVAITGGHLPPPTLKAPPPLPQCHLTEGTASFMVTARWGLNAGDPSHLIALPVRVIARPKPIGAINESRGIGVSVLIEPAHKSPSGEDVLLKTTYCLSGEEVRIVNTERATSLWLDGEVQAGTSVVTQCPVQGEILDILSLRRDGGGRNVQVPSLARLEAPFLNPVVICVAGENANAVVDIGGGLPSYVLTLRGGRSDVVVTTHRAGNNRIEVECPYRSSPAQSLTVQAVDGGGRVATSKTRLRVDCPGTVGMPSAPVVETGMTTSSSIHLSWAPVACAEEYEVSYEEVGSNSSMMTKRTMDLSVRIDELAANREYQFVVRVRVGSNWGAPSVGVTERTAAVPVGVEQTFASTQAIAIRWDEVDGASEYEVQYRSEGGSWESATVKVTRAVVSALTVGTEYQVRVRAKVSGVWSDWSEEIIAMTAYDPLPDPTGVVAVETYSTITLKWNEVEGATEYVVMIVDEHGVAVPGLEGEQPSDTEESHDFSDLTPTTKYTVSVRAKATGKASDWVDVPTWTKAVPPIRLFVSAPSAGCVTGGEIRISTFPRGGGTGRYQVTVNGKQPLPGVLQEYVRHQVQCQETAGEQTFTVVAADAKYPSVSTTETATVTVKQAPSTKLSVAIRAQRLADNRVEYRLRLKDGTEIRPASRYITPAQMTDGEWDDLESLSATTGGKTYALGKVSVRLDNTGCPSVLVFTFLPAQGQRITPSANRFRLDTQAGTWIPSSTFEVTVKTTSSQSSASDQSREDDPQGDWPPDSLMAAAGSEPAQSQSQAVCTAAPTGLDASTFSSTSITLEWDAVSGASQYDVKRTGASEQEVPPSDLSFEFDQLEPNTTYTLEVRARSWQGASNWALIQRTTAAKTALALTVSASPTTCEAGDEVTVEWMVSGGSGASTVTVDGTAQSGSSTKVRCQAEAGPQTVRVVATDQGDSSSVTKRLTLTVTKTTTQTLTAKIAARLLSDHRVEFRLRPTDGAELQVATRYITLPKITAELWYPSGVHTVTIAGTDYTLGVISAWLDNTVCPAQVWVTFIPSGGTQITPSKYKLAVNREVDLWATTSEFEIPLVEMPQNASARGNGNTFERMTEAPDGSSDGPGREGGFMLGDSAAPNAQRDQSATTCTDQPTGLATSSVTSNSATLSWSAVSGASEYDVALGQEASEALASTKLTHDFTGLAANTAYTLRVRARSWQGSSEWSSKAVRTKASSVPVITITAGTSPIAEGDNASFTVTSERSLTTELNVRLSVTEDGDMISGTAPTQVTIASGTDEATLTVATEDDQQAEPDSVVTATLLSGTGYGLGTASSGTVTVSDDDTQVPALKLNVTSSSTSCETGAQVTVSWTVTGGSGSHTVTVNGDEQRGSSVKVTCRATAGTQTVTVKVTDRTNTQLTVTKTLSLTVTWPTFTLTTSATPTSCETDGEVTVEWSVGGGSGTSTVTVDGEAKTGSSTKVTCQDTAGTQTVIVKATDAVDRKLTITERLTLTVTKPPSTVQAKLWARRMSDNRIELELRVEGGTVSSPSKRFADPPQMTDLRWKQSEAMTATIGGRSYNIGRLSGKLQNDRCPSRVEVGLLLASGTRLLPNLRFIETNSTVGNWRSSAEFEITLPTAESASPDRASAGEAPPPEHWLSDTPDDTGDGAGIDGGLMSGDGPSQAPADRAQAGSQSSTTPSCSSVPSSLRTSAITKNSIKLSWSAVPGATQYDLRRGGMVVGSAKTNAYIFSGLAPGRQHRLEVRARDAWGASAWNGKAESTLPEPPDDPSNLQVTAATDSLTLSWGAAARATSYQVRINSGQAVRPNLPPLSHKFTGLSADQSYKLEVQAINRGGRSNWVSVTRKTNPTPVMIEASVSPTSCETGGSVTVRWRVSGGSGTYQVTVGGSAQRTSPTIVPCRQTADTQKIVVKATDTKHTTLSDSEDLSVTVKSPPTVTGQVAARLLSSGKIELAFKPTGGSRILPSLRFYTPNTTKLTKWSASSDVFGPAGTETNRLLGRITVKHIKTTSTYYLDVCFLPAGSSQRICPTKNNFFYKTATVDRWLYTGTITFKPLQTSASLQADSVQGGTQDDQMQEATGNEGSAAGTEGGLMSDLE